MVFELGWSHPVEGCLSGYWPWFLSLISPGPSWAILNGLFLYFQAQVNLGMLQLVFVGICLGFHVWLVVACYGPIWWVFALDFKPD